MSDFEDCLLKAKDALASLRGTAIDEGVGYYFHHLESQECPGEADLAAARDAAERTLKDRVCSLEWLSAMNGGKPISEEDAASLRLKFDAVAPSLVVPAPQVISDLAPARLGLAAAVGAVVGMMVLAPLTRVLLDMRDTGVFVGAPIGAFLLVLAVWQVAKREGLRKVLEWAFGGVLLIEVLAILTGGSILGWLKPLWILLGNRRAGVRHVLVYAGVIVVLVLTKPRSRYDRSAYADTIRSAIAQWLDGAIIALSVLGPEGGPKGGSVLPEAKIISILGKIQSLEDIPQENLPAAVQELFEELRNLGFEEEAVPPEWQENLHEKYETFGYIEPGDCVEVEKRPVIFKGTVLQKGLVCKVRGGM